jgi:hypothetical protein
LTAQPPAHGTGSTKLPQSASIKPSGPELASRSALPGRERKAAIVQDTTTIISARDAALPPTEPKAALKHRQLNPLTPYKAEAWARELENAGLLPRFSKIVTGLRFGFILNFPPIVRVQAPPNKQSIATYKTEFDSIIQKELRKLRYIGPFDTPTLLSLIGPFQSSPLSIIPKPGKPGKFRLVQNFSFPHNPNPTFPNPSVNSFINATDFPTTWGKFSIVYLLISRLPADSEAATRDVSEAYRTIPLHPSQWPAAVVHISDNEFCVDTCTVFGATPSAGAYGHLADTGAEILRHKGIGPLDKWVDDHIFIRIRMEHLSEYNQKRANWHQDLAERGIHQTGSRVWFGGRTFDNDCIEEFSEDCSRPIVDLSGNSPRSDHDRLFTHNLQDIDEASKVLGIVWEESKDQPFGPSTIYIRFEWDLHHWCPTT